MQPPSYPPPAPPGAPPQGLVPPGYGPPGAPPPGYPVPYGPPPQPPKKGMSTGCIIGLVAGGVCLLLGVLFVVGAIVGFRRVMLADQAAKAAASAASREELSETYATPNGLLRAHYPDDFAAKTLDDSTLLVSRNLGSGLDEAITLGAVKEPITNDVHEFARLLLGAVQKNVLAKGGVYTIGKDHPARCLGKHPGIEIETTFHIGLSGEYVSKTCFYLEGDRGYEFRYDAPRSRPGEVALLQSIIDATEVTP